MNNAVRASCSGGIVRYGVDEMPIWPLLHEDEIDGRHQTGEGGEVVPGQMLLKGDDGEEREDCQGDDLLNDLELNEREGTAVALEADSVGGHHEAVFKKRDRPGKEHDGVERPVADEFGALELEMGVPGERHEDVRDEQKPDGCKAFGEHVGQMLRS